MSRTNDRLFILANDKDGFRAGVDGFDKVGALCDGRYPVPVVVVIFLLVTKADVVPREDFFGLET